MALMISERHWSGAVHEGVFSGGWMSVDSWTPGPKPLCHRHPTGPHPSGLLWTPWTPAKGDSTKSSFALRRLVLEQLPGAAEGVGHLLGRHRAGEQHMALQREAR